MPRQCKALSICHNSNYEAKEVIKPWLVDVTMESKRPSDGMCKAWTKHKEKYGNGNFVPILVNLEREECKSLQGRGASWLEVERVSHGSLSNWSEVPLGLVNCSLFDYIDGLNLS